jgi:hypothetical protein
VGFPKNSSTTFDQTTGNENKAKHIDIFKVTKTFIEQFFRSSCVNMIPRLQSFGFRPLQALRNALK